MASILIRPFLLPFALSVIVFTSLSRADGFENKNCTYARQFNNYNATKTYPIPSVEINKTSNGLINGPADDPWYLTFRLGDSDGFNTTWPWINVGNSNTTGISWCMKTTDTYFNKGFSFSREVIERGLNDNGDCNTMLGTECRNALQEQYNGAALTSMQKGECDLSLDLKVPEECNGVIEISSMFSAEVGLSNSSFTKDVLKESNCSSDIQPLNSSMHMAGGGSGAEYNYAVRFPRLWFFTFWPKRLPSQMTISQDDVRAVLMCARTDDIQQGSSVPPSAEELMNASGVTFKENPSNPNAPTPSGSGSPPSGGVGRIGTTWGTTLGAAALAALLIY